MRMACEHPSVPLPRLQCLPFVGWLQGLDRKRTGVRRRVPTVPFSPAFFALCPIYHLGPLSDSHTHTHIFPAIHTYKHTRTLTCTHTHTIFLLFAFFSLEKLLLALLNAIQRGSADSSSFQFAVDENPRAKGLGCGWDQASRQADRL